MHIDCILNGSFSLRMEDHTTPSSSRAYSTLCSITCHACTGEYTLQFHLFHPSMPKQIAARSAAACQQSK